MTDGQLYTLILFAETAVILGAWWTINRIRLRRQRRAWIRQLEARQRRQERRRAA